MVSFLIKLHAWDIFCIAIKNCCQVLIYFVNQNLTESSTSGGFTDMYEDAGNIAVYQNVGVQGIKRLGTKQL